jgi:hypothetical protein
VTGGLTEPLPQTRRGWIGLVITGILFAIAFFLVVRFYDAEGGSSVQGGLGESAESGIILSIEPDSIDPNTNVSELHLSFGAEGSEYVGTDGRLLDNLRITIATTDGLDEIKFPAGTVLSEHVVDVRLDGEEATYPFDTHAGYALFMADTYERKSDGSITSNAAVPIGIQAGGGVNGWNTAFTLPTDFAENQAVSVEFTRAFSTKIFAILIIVIAGILALLSLTTAALVWADRRPAEAALLGWTGALLFALPLLRTYLPNAPPFGASIDMYAYLWFILAAGAAAIMVVLGWNHQRFHERQQAERERAASSALEPSRDGGPHAS